jgi:CheY-like chemotaxis protein
MPGMDGFELLRALRDDPRCRNVPAAAVTAFAMGGDREKVLARGFDAYLEKPIDLPALTAVLNELLAGGNKRTQGE